MSTLRRFFTEEGSGQALIEFALTLPIVLLVITGTFDVARAVWQENTLAYAAREGTRYAIVHGSGYPDRTQIAYPGNTSGITDVVRQAAVGIGGTITVTSTWPGPDGVLGNADDCYDRNCPVAVVATSQFVPLPSYYMLGSAFQITLKGGSQLVIQR
jgi:Flp pilus assembly protein TadG